MGQFYNMNKTLIIMIWYKVSSVMGNSSWTVCGLSYRRDQVKSLKFDGLPNKCGSANRALRYTELWTDGLFSFTHTILTVLLALVTDKLDLNHILWNFFANFWPAEI